MKPTGVYLIKIKGTLPDKRTSKVEDFYITITNTIASSGSNSPPAFSTSLSDATV